MPRNKRVAKEVVKYSLRLDPSDYKKIQQISSSKDIPINRLLQSVIREYISREES